MTQLCNLRMTSSSEMKMRVATTCRKLPGGREAAARHPHQESAVALPLLPVAEEEEDEVVPRLQGREHHKRRKAQAITTMTWTRTRCQAYLTNTRINNSLPSSSFKTASKKRPK